LGAKILNLRVITLKLGVFIKHLGIQINKILVQLINNCRHYKKGGKLKSGGQIFLSPGHDRVVTIKSRNFSIAKVWCCMCLFWSTRGCYLAAHSSIHALLILRSGLTRLQLLRPDNNMSAGIFLIYRKWGPGGGENWIRMCEYY